MSDELDDFVSRLQEQIYESTREAYGEIAYKRWLNPSYMGSIKDPDGYARLKGVCGDTMEIFLRLENDRVSKASFRTNGCGSSIVCGSMASEMAIGRTPDELLEITGEAILEALGGLPEEDEHCALLADETLQEALIDYMLKTTRKEQGQTAKTHMQPDP